MDHLAEGESAQAALEAQAKAIADKKAAEATALGKIIQMIVDKLHEHLFDEIEYYTFFKEPPMIDKKGSDVPSKLWRVNSKLKVDFVNKNSETLQMPPLKKLLDKLENDVNNSRDIVNFQSRIRSEGIDQIEDAIFERFFTQEYQVQTVQTDEFYYVGTINKFGKPDGIGRMIYPNNSIYEGAFKNGEPAGYGRRFDPNGSIFTGLYLKGIRHGRGILIDKKGVELKGNWQHYTFDGDIKKPVTDADA